MYFEFQNEYQFFRLYIMLRYLYLNSLLFFIFNFLIYFDMLF